MSAISELIQTVKKYRELHYVVGGDFDVFTKPTNVFEVVAELECKKKDKIDNYYLSLLSNINAPMCANVKFKSKNEFARQDRGNIVYTIIGGPEDCSSVDVFEHLSEFLDANTSQGLYSECFEEIFEDIKINLMVRLPLFANILDKCRLVDDPTCDTLYVTYNEWMFQYEIHYNAGFIIKLAISDALCKRKLNRHKPFKSEYLVDIASFLIVHELSHVVRLNLGVNNEHMDQEYNFDHRLANLVEDLVINQSIYKAFMDNPLGIGVFDKVSVQGLIDEKYLRGANAYGEIFCREFRKYFGYEVDIIPSGRSSMTITNNVVNIDFIISNELIAEYKGNSLELTRVINSFIKAVTTDAYNSEMGIMITGDKDKLEKAIGKELPEGQNIPTISDLGDGNELSQGTNSNYPKDNAEKSSNSKNNGSNKAGNNESSSSIGDNLNSDLSSDGNTSSRTDGFGNSEEMRAGSGSVSGGSGNIGREERDNDLMSENAKKALQAILESSSEPVVDPGKLQAAKDRTELKKEELEKISNRVSDAIGTSVSGKSQIGVTTWRGKLKAMISRSLGIKEVYNNEIPSARVEGAFGRDEEVPDFKRIVLAIDCSGSMSASTFKKIISEVSAIGKALNIKKVEIDIVYWGTRAFDIKAKSFVGLYQKIESSYAYCGGTRPECAFRLIRTKYNRFDICIVMTDGDFMSITEEEKAFCNKYKKKLVWCLTSDGNKSDILKMDSTAESRIVKQK